MTMTNTSSSANPVNLTTDPGGEKFPINPGFETPLIPRTERNNDDDNNNVF